MGKKRATAKSRAGSQAAARARDSEDEESESGALSGTSSEKQRLFETRAQLREAKQESLRLAGELAEDDEADEDDDDDYDDTHAPDEEDELATVMRFKSTTLLSMTWKHPLQTSRSSGRSLRPNVKPILIVQTPPPMPPLLALLTSIFRTRTDPHTLNVFRNAQITLRLLIICESSPFSFVSLFLFYICAYSTYSFYSDLILVLTRFFVLSVLLFALREAFKL
jgi:hypothetical protein